MKPRHPWENGPWGPAEDAWLLECLAAGDTLSECAQWSGREFDDVAERAFVLAAPMPEKHRQVLELWDLDLARPLIAERLGVTETRVQVALACARRKGYPVPLRWHEGKSAPAAGPPKPKRKVAPARTPEEAAAVCLLVASHLSFDEISRRLGITKGAVAGVVFRAGGSRRVRAEAIGRLLGDNPADVRAA